MKMNFPAPYACLRKQGQPMAKGQRPGLLPKIAKTSASPSTRDQTEDANATADVMTAEQLIIRAKRHIGAGEASRIESFRAAADDIARACEKGLSQREAGKRIGKSGPWVNQLLKWQRDGYVGAPFADKIVVQALNKGDSASKGAEAEPTTASASLSTEGSDCAQCAAPFEASTAKTSTEASVDYDYRLPQSQTGKTLIGRFSASPSSGVRSRFGICFSTRQRPHNFAFCVKYC
jgi:hypothetical protein